MTDRELLELAAKAAGYHWPLKWPHPSPVDVPHEWNPLTDDGDALRLAVKLNMAVVVQAADFQGPAYTEVVAPNATGNADENHNGDPYAATRRAIVRAAAEIGRSLS